MRSGLTKTKEEMYQRGGDRNGNPTHIESYPRNCKPLDHQRLGIWVKCQAFQGCCVVLASIPPHPDPIDESIVSLIQSPESGGFGKKMTLDTYQSDEYAKL